MRESIRTVILLILLAMLVGFVVWSSRQNETQLQDDRRAAVYAPAA